MKEQTLTLTLTLAEANLMMAALGELPAKVSRVLMARLEAEAVAQLNKPSPPAAPPSEAPPQ